MPDAAVRLKEFFRIAPYGKGIVFHCLVFMFSVTPIQSAVAARINISDNVA